MTVTFYPTQLEAAVQASVLSSVVNEFFPVGTRGEVSVVQRFRDEPMMLVFRQVSHEPVAVPLDRQTLYSPDSEEQLRERVRELRDRHSALCRRSAQGAN